MISRSNTASPGIGRSGPEKIHRRAQSFRPVVHRKKHGLHVTTRKQCRDGIAGSQNHRGARRPALQVDNSARRDIELRIKCLPSDQLLERFHELIDKRLNETLMFVDAFELDRIEARLISEEQPDMDRVMEFRNAWALERTELVSSIERLIADLKAGSADVAVPAK